MDKEKRADIIKAITVIGFTVSVFYHYILSSYASLNYYPFNTFLFSPSDRFNDFYNIFRATRNLNPYASPVSVYFPFTFILMYLLSAMTLFVRQLAFAVFIFIFIRYTLSYIYRRMPSSDELNRKLNTFIFTFMSYPFLFSLDRGNIECLLFIFLALFLYYYQKDDDLKSILFLSLAIAMKLYPAVYAVLFLADKKYKNILLTAVITALLTLISASILEGGIINSFSGLKNNLNMFREAYIMSDHGLQHNTSIYGTLKIIFSRCCPILLPFLNYYTALALLVCLLITIYIVLKKDALWKKFTLLVFITLLLPQVSYDYKLIHLFIPLMMFVNHDEPSKFDLSFSILFGLLLIPKDYYIIAKDISVAVLINPALMIMIASIILWDRQSLGTVK